MTTSATADRRRVVTMPLADFSVKYSWRAGTLPPPHHWEYGITIGAGGAGELVVVPDYASPGVPRWSERFPVAREHMDWLYRTMLERGLLAGRWSGEPSIGGSAEWMTVQGGGLVVEIPASVSADRRESAAAMCGAVRALVPKELWTKMETARQQYVRARTAELARTEPPVVVRRASEGPFMGRRALTAVVAAGVAFGIVMTVLALLVRLTR